MRARFAIWERGPILYFDETCLSEMERYGVGVDGGERMSIDLQSGVLKLVVATSIGWHLMPSTFPDSDAWPYTLREEDGIEGVRCGTMNVNLAMTPYGWISPLPVDHELPWPFYKELDGKIFDKHAAVVREIRLRLKSAGEARITIPHDVQKLLTPEERIGLFMNWKI